jgi:hypothetical protein
VFATRQLQCSSRRIKPAWLPTKPAAETQIILDSQSAPVTVIWKMEEDLSGPYPGYGLGSMDAYDGYVSYRVLDEEALAPEIAGMRALIGDVERGTRPSARHPHRSGARTATASTSITLPCGCSRWRSLEI